MAGSLCDIPDVSVGHVQDAEAQTGCSVVLFGQGAVCGVDVRGAAPGTRETDLLNPVNAVQKVDALVLSGGSAFGLDTASGVMRWLEEQGRGFETGYGRVPIVPAAVIFDLNFGDPRVRPDAAMGYRAAQLASRAPFASGNTGAGAGATLGKMIGISRAMKGGIGSACVAGPDGLRVAAMVVVNALGEVRDPDNGQRLAGACDEQGQLLDLPSLALRAEGGAEFSPGANTTIGVVCCNARLDKTAMTKVAQMAHDGLARTIWPVHTMSDGDTLFAATTDGVSASVTIVGMLAARAVASAVIDGVSSAHSARGVPGLATLGGE
jgi:L-aminopeptidase/D-esterase-like protein